MNIDYFNKYDLEVLDRVEDKLKNISDNKLISDFNKLNKKLHSIYNTNKVLSEYKDINVVVNGADDKINTINDCIKNKKSIFIDYLGSSGKIVKREIIPINIFEFENKNGFFVSFLRRAVVSKISYSSLSELAAATIFTISALRSDCIFAIFHTSSKFRKR